MLQNKEKQNVLIMPPSNRFVFMFKIVTVAFKKWLIS